MSKLLNPKAAEPPLQKRQAMAKSRLITGMSALFTHLKVEHERMAQIVWDNPRGLTPQEVIDGFGTDAAELFRLSGLLVQVLNEAEPGSYPYQLPYAFTVKPDGTVTLGAKRTS